MTDMLPPSHDNRQPNPVVVKNRRLWIVSVVVLILIAASLLVFRPATNEKMVKDDGKSAVYRPMHYDTVHWQQADTQSEDIEILKSVLGGVVTKQTALDFYGKRAMAYYYGAKDEPPLYVVQSKDMLEVVWYYAAPTDDEFTKERSLVFAKRGYRLMSMAGGRTGEHIVHQMLQGVSLNTQPVGVFDLHHGTCQEYLCRLVLKKSARSLF